MREHVSLPANTPPGAVEPAVESREFSVDLLRGWVVALMIFVNDLAGSDLAPGWLQHEAPQVDAMSIADVVFPAFLFLAGMSVPLAIERAESRGISRGQLLLHAVLRSLGLILMGVMVEAVSRQNPWFHGSWGFLVYVALAAAFLVGPRPAGPGRHRWRSVRLAGWLALVVLALAYDPVAGRDHPAGHPHAFGGWFDLSNLDWFNVMSSGVLGLIGWAYLATAVTYLFLTRRREWLLGATGLFTIAYVAGVAHYAARLTTRDWLAWAAPALLPVLRGLAWLNGQLDIAENLATPAAIAMAGCCLGSILTARSDLQTRADRLRWAAMFAAGLGVAALCLDPLYGLNKDQATPAWGLLSAAITTVAWMVAYGVLPNRPSSRASRLFATAGREPLLVYLLHPFVYLAAGLVLLPLDFYHDDDWPVGLHLAGSAAMALLLVYVTGVISRRGYRLKT